ncbi:MAG: hypothetical protein MMC33_000755 [Icmadophila ericetorum]|nr:hypothetical protein [Icmadophila ericetorum]
MACKDTTAFSFNGGITESLPFNIEAARYHVAILRRFRLLLVKAENHIDIINKERALKTFLVYAEARYVMYLDLLCTVTKGKEAEGEELKESLPLPPWDVAMVFHSHMLSPFQYFSDLHLRPRYKSLRAIGLQFPLKRLNSLIFSPQWSDTDSAKCWKKFFPETPYQLWDRDPQTCEIMNLQGTFDFRCPWCSVSQAIEFTSWAKMRLDGSDQISCEECVENFTADRLSARYFLDDIRTFCDSGSDESSQYIKAAGMNFHTGDPQLLASTSTLREMNIKTTPLWSYISSERGFDWDGFASACQKSHESARKKNITLDLSLLNRIQKAYENLVWPDLGFDLVAAVIRQWGFTQKITNMYNMDTPEAMIEASKRYHKFMMLMKEPKPGHGMQVPTLDVDLFWHTHQLFPDYYRQWCRYHVGRRINHDDTVGDGDLAKALESTSKAWKDTYGENYTKQAIVSSSKGTGNSVATINPTGPSTIPKKPLFTTQDAKTIRVKTIDFSKTSSVPKVSKPAQTGEIKDQKGRSLFVRTIDFSKKPQEPQKTDSARTSKIKDQKGKSLFGFNKY